MNYECCTTHIVYVHMDTLDDVQRVGRVPRTENLTGGQKIKQNLARQANGIESDLQEMGTHF